MNAATTDRLLGKRFRPVALPDYEFTVVSLEDDRATCHDTNGHRQHVPVSGLIEALDTGAMVESEDAPFVLEDSPAPRTAAPASLNRGSNPHLFVPVRRHGRTVLIPAADYIGRVRRA